MSAPVMTNKRRRHADTWARGRLGFTLIELMVALLLGLIVIGGVISVFLAGQRTYRTNEALSDVANGSRIAFELLARNIRNAGLSGCDNSNGRIANVLNTTTLWYTNLYGRLPFGKSRFAVMVKQDTAAVLYPACGAG